MSCSDFLTTLYSSFLIPTSSLLAVFYAHWGYFTIAPAKESSEKDGFAGYFLTLKAIESKRIKASSANPHKQMLIKGGNWSEKAFFTFKAAKGTGRGWQNHLWDSSLEETNEKGEADSPITAARLGKHENKKKPANHQ